MEFTQCQINSHKIEIKKVTGEFGFKKNEILINNLFTFLLIKAMLKIFMMVLNLQEKEATDS